MIFLQLVGLEKSRIMNVNRLYWEDDKRKKWLNMRFQETNVDCKIFNKFY